MEKDTEAEELSPSVDLAHATEEHLNLLELVDIRQDLYNGHVLQESIRRYLLLWLPLMAENEDEEKLLPPIDIQWVWYCHTLSPIQYAEDVKELVGKEIPHTWLSKSERSRSTERAKVYWEKKYAGEPFELKNDVSAPSTETSETTTKLFKRLEDCVSNERHFYYQVSLPHYRRDTFIETSLKRYKRFLSFVKSLKSSMDVSSDVELIWRCHILFSESYKSDSTKWFGFVLDHSPSALSLTANRCDDSLTKEKPDVAELPGGLTIKHVFRRGEAPRGSLADLSADYKMGMSAKICQLSIEEIYLEGYKFENKSSKLTASVLLTTGNQRNHTLKSLVEFQGCHYDPEERKPIKFTVDPQRYDSLKFEITKKSGSMLKTSKTVQGSHMFDLIPLIETCPNEGTTFSETGNFTMKDQIVRVSARGKIKPTDRGPIQLSHIPCSKDESYSVHDEGLRSTLLRTGLSLAELENIGDVLVSTHRFINRSSRLIFTCKLHQKLPFLSLVHVLSHDELVVEGHIAAVDTLPYQEFPGIPWQSEGEIGFVIKNSLGDWGIIVAGQSSESSGASRRGIHETEMKLYTIAPVSKLWTMVSFRLPGPDGNFVVDGTGYKIDLKTGSLTLQKSCPDVAEIVALAYGIATLHGMLWSSNKEPSRTLGKSKPSVHFAASNPRSWSDIARGNRFLNMISQ